MLVAMLVGEQVSWLSQVVKYKSTDKENQQKHPLHPNWLQSCFSYSWQQPSNSVHTWKITIWAKYDYGNLFGWIFHEIPEPL